MRDVIRTNQGSMMMALLLPLHRFRIWVLRYLLAGVNKCGIVRSCCLYTDFGSASCATCWLVWESVKWGVWSCMP